MNFMLEKLHAKALEKYRKDYDDSVGLLKEYLSDTYRYHSNLNNAYVHPVGSSAEFAVALLDGEKEDDVKTAEKIIRKVISLQDKRTEKNTFGLWQYYYEESIDEMSPPDWNMACFNCIALLQAYIDYRDKFSDETNILLKQACIDACKCMIKRDVQIDYTNVVVMTVYCTVVAGELFDDEIYRYGKDFFRKFYYHVKKNGYIDEYNSSCYSMLLVRITGIMLQHIKDEELLHMVEDVNDMAWKMISEHFHPNTGEWVGPQLRAYTDFIDDSVKSLIEIALDYKIELTENKEIALLDMRYGAKCPEKYKQAFIDKNKKYSIRRMINPGFNYPWFGHSRGEMNYITPEYTLGTFDRSTFWNQHRPVSMYMGNTENKCCLRLRLLHDFYDFAGGLITTAQYENVMISQINYIPDGGDRHGGLDPIKDETIHAKDFRFRVQITGHPKCAEIKQNGNIAEITVNGVKINCGFPYMELEGFDVRYEVNSDDEGVYFDAVLADTECDICFKDMKDAAAVFYLAVNTDDYEMPECQIDGDFLETNWQACGNDYRLITFKSPHKFIETVMTHRQYLNGEWIEKLENANPIG